MPVSEVVVRRVEARPEGLDQHGHLVDREPEGAGALRAPPQERSDQPSLAVPADP